MTKKEITAKWKSEHKEHIAKYNKETRPKYRVSAIKTQTKYYIENKRLIEKKRIMRVCNITGEEYEAQMQVLNCAHRSKTMRCFDHCHTTKVFRGILCNECNKILGNAEIFTFSRLL